MTKQESKQHEHVKHCELLGVLRGTVVSAWHEKGISQLRSLKISLSVFF